MIDTTTGLAAPCASGCTRRDDHLPTCEGECKGCQPRPAEHGILCQWCYQRLAEAVTHTEQLAAHLYETARLLVISGTAYSEDTPTAGEPSERLILHPAWLAADELESDVASWVLLVLEEHDPPLLGPVASKQTNVAWLENRLEWCSRQEWAPDMRRELCSTIATLTARWPTEDSVQPPRSLDVPCPLCEQVSLVYAPPSFAGQPFAVGCQNPDCARTFSEDEWQRFVHYTERAELGRSA
ncbi:hypothetical protein GCM10025865_01050 [Paraoerskovia sediminicola]|uniref:Uncharacterized protein n=1 Tax=Paraoerskovia sediminicola TaxID=1138587 RepID=A0ABM8FYH8_9CELL|nr:hypothetical protein [Paraoerskovia sediminicola]BDZ40806.1 hypothetical protein GCM10025865_01050 [Paraoerskovia sediminicola]